tara:strand:+ start:517 stop:834 length:318 start_codon:yes stop_codon:yes gene_type:complete
MKFDVSYNEDEKITVDVELPHQKRTGKIVERQRFQTDDVIGELKKREIKHGKVLETSDIKNWQADDCSGTWIFDKKTIDKSSKDVILNKNKSKKTKKAKVSKAKN